MEYLIIKVDKETKDKFKLTAIEERRTMSDLVREYIARKIDKTVLR